MTKPLTYQERNKQLYNLSEDMRRCTSCSLWKKRTLPIAGSGTAKAKVMLIYYSPSEEDDRQGTALNGEVRKSYLELLKKHKLKEKDVFVTPLVKCHAKSKSLIKRKNISTCKNKYLTSQIELINPNMIILCGSKVIKSILGSNYPLKRYQSKIVKKNNKKYLLISNLK